MVAPWLRLGRLTSPSWAHGAPKVAVASSGLSAEGTHFYARIYAAARAACLAELRRGGCGEADAEDIFATTLERVMRKFDSGGSAYGPAQTIALLKKACLHRLIDERRHCGVLRMVPLEEASAREGEEAGPAQAAEKREAVAIAREAIASLSERDRALFFQRHHLGLTPQEILRRNPGLSLRTYRKVIGRANARAMRTFEEIKGGERCAHISGEHLRSFVAGEGTEKEFASVRRHLRHCGACRAEVAGHTLSMHSHEQIGAAWRMS
jgi:DNA-directed RNA polymerase specialized sigma24 family protein